MKRLEDFDFSRMLIRRHYGHAVIGAIGEAGVRACDEYCYSPSFASDAELQAYEARGINPLHGDFRTALSVRSAYAFGEWA